ncbi:ABC transporter permease [Pengzhenrongella sicca]|uniref:Transport permease protein n=1 Tax=Pengzhenrongella sicca TaxID=2819238 RepID=A0A8A4ZG17_9MICO|nr:ABC transporter permease [Pengzhenrongella sicca]QTE30225.1 ABC transporter permease [Pengzhenrongella sicca]
MSVAADVSTKPSKQARRPTRASRAQTRLEYRAARQLLKNLVRRDLKIQHRGTILGALWSLITPLLQVAVYTFVFTVIMPSSPVADAGDTPFAVYLFVGLVMWNLLQNGVLAGTGSVLGSGYLLQKVYFRREILPLTSVLSAGVTFLWEMAVAIIVVTIFVGPPGWQIVFLPLLVLITATLAFGIAALLSAAAVFFRDVQHFIGIAIQMWFWATPVIYSLTIIEDRPSLLKIIQLNPMAGILVSLRNILIMHTMPDWKLLGYAAVVSVFFLVVGLAVFRRNERMFAEMI